ncbi:MAG: DUF493 family protein [Betaproteobacteria bacterium]|nr:DUF493 family protein [Betaproteobacteria bacterium]
MPDADKLLQFPCDFPIKIMGRNVPRFRAQQELIGPKNLFPTDRRSPVSEPASFAKHLHQAHPNPFQNTVIDRSAQHFVLANHPNVAR